MVQYKIINLQNDLSQVTSFIKISVGSEKEWNRSLRELHHSTGKRVINTGIRPIPGVTHK